jgi:SAM-dependent methyltransferase
MSTPKLHNRTRSSSSIPAKLRQKGRWLEIPLYHLLKQSYLAREGLENSGSYRFADHIYRNQPSGSGFVGTLLDRALMSLPAVRSFRNRYLAARDELVDFLVGRASFFEPVHIVSVPCGLPRELSEAARIAAERAPGCLDHVYFHGIDLDKKVLGDAVKFAATQGLPTFFAHYGDALDAKSYPITADFITCTGLAEFLDDAQLEKLYGIFRQVLKPDGKLFTSGMRRLPLSDYLLELAELHTHYRNSEDLERLAKHARFTSIRTRTDGMKIQAFLLAGR